MRKVLVIAALAAMAILLDSGMASARGRKCGGGRHHRGGCGGGGCYVGGCGTYGGGCGYGGGYGGYASGGCATCGGYAYGGGYGGGSGYALLNADTTATIVVDLPADAKLTVDGEATVSTSATRVLQTPELEPGKTFHYTLEAQVERDGKVQSVSHRVEVRAGETSRVSLTLPTATVAAR